MTKMNTPRMLAVAALFVWMTHALPSYSQSFTLSGYSPVLNLTDAFSTSESYVTIANVTNSDKMIKIQRTINTLASGHMEFFCFGAGSTAACYPPGTDFSGGNDTLPANSTNSSFKGTIEPFGVYGYSSIHYRFFDTNNPADSVGVDLAWNFTTSIGENQNQFGISKPRLNPADAFTTLSYSLQSDLSSDRLVVYNMLGSVVRTMDIPGRNGVLVLPTADLESGMYVVTYQSQGKTKDSCRLVVAHR